ncbi:MAG: immunoglobulin domain-containing protein, partial [Verrucomicrobiota bacterium]
LPSISVQPVSRTVPAGTNVSFSVTASGLAPPVYQWRFNQSDLPGKTNSVLSLTNVQSANTGDYDVVVANIYGAITSSVATLTVLPVAPIITTQAVSRVASVGQTASFVVAAKGSEPMTCQWQFNGADLPGANSFTLNLNNVNSSVAGTYRAAVSNAVGFAFSTNVTLIVSPVVVWGRTNSQQLQGASLIPASATNIIAIAAGKPTDAGASCFALRSDGVLTNWGGFTAIPANTTNVVAISAGGPGSRAGENNVALIGDGSVVHWGALGKQTVPAAISNLNLVAVAAGAYHQLALLGDGNVRSWGSYGTGPAVVNATNVPASATNVIAIAAGTDTSFALRVDGKVVVWGLKPDSQAAAFSNVLNVAAISAGGSQALGLRSDGSTVGYVVTNNGPQLLLLGLPPPNATNLTTISAGLSHSLALRPDGTVFAWGNTNYGQTAIPAIAMNSLAIAAGSYHSMALVPDPFAPPILPRIARPPLGRTLKAGDNVVFNALAIGGLPLRYQWLLNGSPLAGKTNTWLALPNAHPSEAGDYQLVAMNDFGATTSVVATVTVSIPSPVLNSAMMTTDGFRFSFTSIAGVIYVVEYKDNLTAGAWNELERRFGAGGLETVRDDSPNAAGRFYRVRALYAPSPKLGAISESGSALNFSFATVEGAQYVVEYTDQLAPPTWQALQTISGTGSSVNVSNSVATIAQRFFRLRLR